MKFRQGPELLTSVCSSHNLKLNASKSKEMIVARRLAPLAPSSSSSGYWTRYGDADPWTHLQRQPSCFFSRAPNPEPVQQLPSSSPCPALAWALRWCTVHGDGSYHHLPSSLCLTRLVGPDICWGLRSSGVILEETAATPVSSSRRRSGHLSQWRRRRTLVYFKQWWHLMPMSSRLLKKGLIICVLESILFFSLLRMIVILFQEYYFNDNVYIYSIL